MLWLFIWQLLKYGMMKLYDNIFQVISANENYEKEITALKENRPLVDSGKQNDRAELEGQIRRLQAENSALQKKCLGKYYKITNF